MHALILALLLIASPVHATWIDDQFAAIAAINGATAASDCPAWGTYGTSTGNILFAWDGSHPTGQTYGCNSSETGIEGTNTGGTISGSGADTVFTMDADDDNLAWSYAIDTDNPYTVCMELQPAASLTGNQHVWQISANSTTYAVGTLTGLGYVRLTYKAQTVSETPAGTNAVTADGSTWTDVMWSAQFDAGNDMGVSHNGGSTWEESDNDQLAFDAAETTFLIGNDILIGITDTTSIRRVAVLVGYKAACPAW